MRGLLTGLTHSVVVSSNVEGRAAACNSRETCSCVDGREVGGSRVMEKEVEKEEGDEKVDWKENVGWRYNGTHVLEDMDKILDTEENFGNGESTYNNLNILMEGRQGEPSQNRLQGDFGQDEKEKPTGSLKKGVREGRMTNKVKCVSWGVNRTLGFDSEVPTINIRWEKGIKVKLKKSRVWHSKIVNNKSKNIVMKFRNKIEYRVVKSNGKKCRTGAKAVNSRRVKETEIEKLDTDKYNGDHQKRDFSMFPEQVSGKKECEKVIAEVSKQSEVGDILVGCANINGWSEKELEVIGEVKKNRLDIIGLIETKIRAEQGVSWKNYFKDIKYECSGACREDGDKQGGGITVAWRKELDISIWKKERENEDRNWLRRKEYGH